MFFFYSRWITSASCTLRLFCQTANPSRWLIKIVSFILNIYAPSVFAIKKDPNVVNGSRHLFSIIKRARDHLTIKEEFGSFMVTILNNSYFLLQEHVTLGKVSFLGADSLLPFLC